MQKKAEGKRISKSDAKNRLYREVRIWNDGDPSHGSGHFREKPYPFTVDPSKIGVRTGHFFPRKVWEPVDIFMNMFGIPSVCETYNEVIDRIVDSTNVFSMSVGNLNVVNHRPGRLAADPRLHGLDRWLTEADTLQGRNYYHSWA
jgi:hypothetical protein